MDFAGRSEVYRRRKYVVGTLPHIDVVVRVDFESVIARQRGDDFVQIHIGAGA